jgi:hypothetical protein
MAWAGRTDTGHGVVQVDEERDALAELPSTSVGQRASASGMCYIIFTSGSTGRPKGAVLQHDSAVNFLHFINRRAHAGCWEVMRQAAVQRAEPGLGACRRMRWGEGVVLQKTSTSFDPSIMVRLGSCHRERWMWRGTVRQWLRSQLARCAGAGGLRRPIQRRQPRRRGSRWRKGHAAPSARVQAAERDVPLPRALSAGGPAARASPVSALWAAVRQAAGNRTSDINHPRSRRSPTSGRAHRCAA